MGLGFLVGRHKFDTLPFHTPRGVWWSGTAVHTEQQQYIGAHDIADAELVPVERTDFTVFLSRTSGTRGRGGGGRRDRWACSFSESIVHIGTPLLWLFAEPPLLFSIKKAHHHHHADYPARVREVQFRKVRSDWIDHLLPW